MGIGTPTVGTMLEQTASSTPTPVAYPISVNPGDCLILAVGSGNSSPLAAVPGPPWTLITQLSSTGGTANPCCGAWYAIAQGNEGGSSFSMVHGSFVSAQILAFPGVDPNNPIDVAPTTFDPGATTQATVDLPSQTLLTPGSALVSVAASSNTTTQSATPPTGFTETADRVASGGRSWGVAYQLGLPEGATGIQTVTFNSSSARVVGLLLALRPYLASPVAADALAGWRRGRRRH